MKGGSDSNLPEPPVFLDDMDGTNDVDAADMVSRSMSMSSTQSTSSTPHLGKGAKLKKNEDSA